MRSKAVVRLCSWRPSQYGQQRTKENPATKAGLVNLGNAANYRVWLLVTAGILRSPLWEVIPGICRCQACVDQTVNVRNVDLQIAVAICQVDHLISIR